MSSDSRSPGPGKSGPSALHSAVPADQLRNHATSARVDAIWARLEAGLPQGVPQRASGRWHQVGLGAGLGSAALGAAFAIGVWVGSNGSAHSEAGHDPVALQEEAHVSSGAGMLPNSSRANAVPETKRTGGNNANAHRSRQYALEAPAELAPQALTETVSEPLPGPVTPQWQVFAAQGEYQMALAVLETNGGFDSAVGHATADELMLLADIARGTGFRQRAVLAWRRVVSQHGSDPQAPLAAWSLGNMLEKSGDQLGAAEAFAAYRALSPQGDFAEDALAREIRMAVQQRDAELANRLSAQYDRAFPNGRRAEEIREQLAVLRREPGSASSVDAGLP